MIITHLFSEMLIHFYKIEWSSFQKKMLDEFEYSIVEFSKSFVPRKPVKLEDSIVEVNRLAIQYGLIAVGSELITIDKRD